MGSINKSHIEADGGILLFAGELILLYCDSVSCEVGGKESFKSRVYLTTHRIVCIVAPYRQNAPVKSICAPFMAIAKCNVEQPVFGANYIEATVRDEADPSKTFSFKLKFSKGGAIEFAMATNRAVAAINRNYGGGAMPPPPAYTPSPSAQYYQAPPTVYAPGYNSGVQMPTQQFPDQPPIGFIYASEAPPPYPGLGGNTGQPAQAGQQQQPAQGGYGGYPGQQQYQQQQQQPAGGYPGQQQPGAQGYPGQQQPGQQQPYGGYPNGGGGGGYPTGQQQGGYPSAGGYPGQAPAQSGYPGQAPAQGGYPQQQPGFGFAPQQQPPAGQAPSAGYPDLSQATSGASGYPGQAPQQQQQQPSQPGGAWPSAPSFNPNWQEDKKNA